MEHLQCLIIGSGQAGYTAAIYAGRANLSPVLYEGIQPGGQITTTTEIENFPGYPQGVTGFGLMEDLRKQAERFGAEVRSGIVTSVDFSCEKKKVTVDGKTEIEADAVIIATGASAKYLGLPDETKYAGMGVSACATCDGFFYRKKNVAVVGGGDTACEEALYLSGICNKVYMIVRKSFLRASDIMQKRVFETPNVEILFEHETRSLFGENGVEGAVLQDTKNGKEVRIAIDGFFLAIGHTPNTKVFAGVIGLDEKGYIQTKPGTQQTNVEGVFAAGDVADPVYQQAITAAASGCRAAIELEKYLRMK